MIHITKNSDKRNNLFKIEYAEPSGLLFVDYPGVNAYLTGAFETIKYSEANFTETDPENGAPIDQELNIIIRGQNKDTDTTINDITGKYLILKLWFSNGDVKIMGVPDNPVLLLAVSSGNPTLTTISTKRTSAEKAKYLTV